MTNTRDIWVFIEQADGQIADVSLELLAKGAELSQTLKGQVWALLLGYQVEALAQKAIHAGADRVLIADHPELELYRTLPYCRVVVDLIAQHQPYIFLVGATPVGRDLAPRVASAAQAGLTADCTDLQIGDYESRKEKKVYKDLLYQIRPRLAAILSPPSSTPKPNPKWPRYEQA